MSSSKVAFAVSNPREGYVSLPEAARYFGCSTRTLQRYIQQCKIPGYRIGPRKIVVKLSEVEETLVPMGAAALRNA